MSLAVVTTAAALERLWTARPCSTWTLWHQWHHLQRDVLQADVHRADQVDLRDES